MVFLFSYFNVFFSAANVCYRVRLCRA